MSEEETKVILVADDEKDLREALAIALANEGFSVITAEDGQQAVDLALKNHPDLIMLDIIMPNVDGSEALRRIRADEWGKNANIIILTALDDLEDISEIVEQGGTEYLIKTEWTLTDVIRKVREKVGKGRK